MNEFMVRKGLWFISVFTFVFQINAQIQVDHNYSAETLVKDVLVDDVCASTSNYLSFTGTNFGIDGIGYFNANGTDFPYEEGIILSTGSVYSAAGGNFDINSSGNDGWAGDNELASATNRNSLFNASFIQFDFVPAIDNISFNFLFASEEYYEVNQCLFSDVFAFLLKEPDGTISNLAVVPGTEDPVSVTTIRPGHTDIDEDQSCGASNVDFFGGINTPQSAISFHGMTVSLKAQAKVVPNQKYSIKLVIADFLDPVFDSAVFLEAGSFKIADVDLGEDRTIDSGDPLCIGEPFELDATTANAQNYFWFFNGTEMTDQRDKPVIAVDQTGEYSVEVALSSSCNIPDSINLEFIQAPIALTEPIDLIACIDEGESMATFDFSDNSTLILGDQDPSIYQVTYYTSEEDAIAFENQIGDTYGSEGNDEVIYARISSQRSCYEIFSFTLNKVEDQLEDGILAPFYYLCRDSRGNILYEQTITTDLSVNLYGFQWYQGTADEQRILVGETSPQLTVNQLGNYYLELTSTQYGCKYLLSTEIIPVDAPSVFEVELQSELFVEDNSVEVILEGDSEYLVSLDGGNFVDQRVFTDLEPGEHTIEYMDIFGCHSDSLTFGITDVPNFFTPNGDGVHDQWGLASIDFLDTAQISIFNKYGQLITMLGLTDKWDGNMNGRPLQSDDYWFRIDYSADGTQKSYASHFSLKR